MTKTILILAIAAAFVAGMIVSATPVFAPPSQAGGDTVVAAAIDALTTAVEGIPNIAGPQGPPGTQIKHVTVLDDAVGNALGWNPSSSVDGSFNVMAPDVRAESTLVVTITNGVQSTMLPTTASCADVQYNDGLILLRQCDPNNNIVDGIKLIYTVTDP